jgi:hypothetical protein
MKPKPVPHIAGNTDRERFDNAVRKVLTAKVPAIPEKPNTAKK